MIDKAAKRKIKVLRVITRLNIGGPSIHVIALSEGLDKEKYQTLLVTGAPGADEGDMLSQVQGKGIDFRYIPELRRDIGLFDFAAFFKILGTVLRFRPDIVHTHTAKAGALGRIAACLAGVPVRIHTFHGHVFDGYFNRLKAGVFIMIERMLGRMTDVAIAVSDKVRTELVEGLRIISRERCSVVPLGFDLEKFLSCERNKGAFRRSLAVPEADLLVGIVGRLVPIKNHAMFLKVCAAMNGSASGRSFKFVVIGDGELKAHLEKTAGEMGLQNVVFTGWIKDLASVYADLDIVALTSINEGTPVSLIEAMAAAKPVVATDVGGVRDIVADGVSGLLVESGDVLGFCAKLNFFAENGGKRESFGKAGRNSVKDRYTRQRLIRDIELLYEDCTKRKGLR